MSEFEEKKTALQDRLKKAREDINEGENALGRGLYDLDIALVDLEELSLPAGTQSGGADSDTTGSTTPPSAEPSDTTGSTSSPTPEPTSEPEPEPEPEPTPNPTPDPSPQPEPTPPPPVDGDTPLVAFLRANHHKTGWLPIPGTEPRQILIPKDWKHPTKGYGTESFWGIGGSKMVISAWGGPAVLFVTTALGTIMARRAAFTNGGHADYGGNEWYDFDIHNLQWALRTYPSQLVTHGPDGQPLHIDYNSPDDPADDVPVAIPDDGRPLRGHVYGSPCWVSQDHSHFAGKIITVNPVPFALGTMYFPNPGGSQVWAFDPVTKDEVPVDSPIEGGGGLIELPNGNFFWGGSKEGAIYGPDLKTRLYQHWGDMGWDVGFNPMTRTSCGGTYHSTVSVAVFNEDYSSYSYKAVPAPVRFQNAAFLPCHGDEWLIIAEGVVYVFNPVTEEFRRLVYENAPPVGYILGRAFWVDKRAVMVISKDPDVPVHILKPEVYAPDYIADIAEVDDMSAPIPAPHISDPVLASGDEPLGDIPGLYEAGLAFEYEDLGKDPRFSFTPYVGNNGGERPEISAPFTEVFSYALLGREHARAVHEAWRLYDPQDAGVIQSASHFPNMHFEGFLLTGDLRSLWLLEDHVDWYFFDYRNKSTMDRIDGKMERWVAYQFKHLGQLAWAEARGWTKKTGYIKAFERTIQYYMAQTVESQDEWRQNFRTFEVSWVYSPLFNGWMQAYIGIAVCYLYMLHGDERLKEMGIWHFENLLRSCGKSDTASDQWPTKAITFSHTGLALEPREVPSKYILANDGLGPTVTWSDIAPYSQIKPEGGESPYETYLAQPDGEIMSTSTKLVSRPNLQYRMLWAGLQDKLGFHPKAGEIHSWLRAHAGREFVFDGFDFREQKCWIKVD